MAALVPPVADERANLLGYLAQARHVVRITAFGLTDEQACATPTASTLSIGGLIKHIGAVERAWTDIVLATRGGALEGYKANFRMGPDETLADVLAGYDTAARHTDEVIAAIADLDQPVPVPRDYSPWFPADIDAWSIRWVLGHLITETYRHAGHADIIRESIDGATAFPLLAAAEGWPATPWLEPWHAPDVVRGEPIQVRSTAW